MKKIFAILSIMALASCGGASTSEEVKDSTVVDSVVTSDSAVLVDSVVVVDSAVPVNGGGAPRFTPVK
jgi:hypothetical protein